ncbi:hypothetical protein HOO65_060317 [Ceratocystis lukuohia]|uniref:Uncharacterized protein n=1 Tax=Ceratocystis lukuohia TaxID=2019550 RepID=A0ABR4ME01_9PEZI
MWLPNFSQLALMAAIFSTQAIAGDKRVPLPSDLGITISQGRYPGKIYASGDGGFHAQFYVTIGSKSIQVMELDNPEHIFKSYEAVLSVWEDQSKLTLKSLDYIVYYQVDDADSKKIDEAIKLFGRDPNGERSIYGLTVSRDSPTDTEAWNHLIAASFAKDAEEICAEYKKMKARYIESFEIEKVIKTLSIFAQTLGLAADIKGLLPRPK